VATDAQTLLTEAQCYACYGGNLRLMRLALIKQWAELVDPTIDTSPQALLDYASCYACFAGGIGGGANLYLLELFVLVLIDQALSASGGGGQDQGRITEEEEARLTEEDERRYTEEL
jgi:hypothetical protein